MINLCRIFFLIYLFAFGNQSFSAVPIDLRLLVDVSGSMKKSDPNSLRSPATALLAALMPEDSLAGIWLFGTNVRPIVPYGNVDNRWNALEKPLARSIGDYDNFTHIENALVSALSVKKPNSKLACHIILLTDGIVDVAGGKKASEESKNRITSKLLPKVKEADCRLHTIALSPRADGKLLTRMAIETGGLYTRISDASDLIPVMIDALELAIRSQQLPVSEDNFLVDEAINQVRILRIKNDDKSPMTLIAPNNTEFNFNKIPNKSTWYNNKSFELVVINEPMRGNWSISGGFGNNDRILIDSPIKLEINDIPATLIQDMSLGLSANLTEKGKVLFFPEDSIVKMEAIFQTREVQIKKILKKTTPDSFSGQIDGLPAGRGILTLKIHEKYRERQIQRTFEILPESPLIKLVENHNKPKINIIELSEKVGERKDKIDKLENLLINPEIDEKQESRLNLADKLFFNITSFFIPSEIYPEEKPSEADSEKEKMSLIERIVVELKALGGTSAETQSDFNEGVIESLEKIINKKNASTTRVYASDDQKINDLIVKLKDLKSVPIPQDATIVSQSDQVQLFSPDKPVSKEVLPGSPNPIAVAIQKTPIESVDQKEINNIQLNDSQLSITPTYAYRNNELIERIVVELKALGGTSAETQSDFNEGVIESLEKIINKKNASTTRVYASDDQKINDLIVKLKDLKSVPIPQDATIVSQSDQVQLFSPDKPVSKEVLPGSPNPIAVAIQKTPIESVDQKEINNIQLNDSQLSITAPNSDQATSLVLTKINNSLSKNTIENFDTQIMQIEKDSATSLPDKNFQQGPEIKSDFNYNDGSEKLINLISPPWWLSKLVGGIAILCIGIGVFAFVSTRLSKDKIH